MSAHMQLYAVTTPSRLKGEIDSVAALLELGAAAVYIRKDDMPEGYLETLYATVPVALHDKVLLPFGVRGAPANINPRLHIKEQHRVAIENLQASVISTSVHSMHAWSTLSAPIRSCFYAPVFASISKPGHRPVRPLNVLAARISEVRAKNRNLPALIALGGVNRSNIASLRDVGFDGAALLGALWTEPDPVKFFAEVLSEVR